MTPARRVAVVGAGLAGCVAALAAAEAGADVVLLERAGEPGGATLDSAGWVWRYVSTTTAARCAPRGAPAVQAAIVDRLDGDLAWLVRHGVQLRATSTGRTFTRGVRIDPEQAIGAVMAAAPRGVLQVGRDVSAARRDRDGAIVLEFRVGTDRVAGCDADIGTPRLEVDAVVLAGGGAAADLDRVARDAGVASHVRARWLRRSARGGDGSTLDLGAALGAGLHPAGEECFVKPVPTGVPLDDPRTLSAWGELVTPGAWFEGHDGSEVERAPHDWSGARAAWRLASTCGGGWLHVPADDLDAELHAGRARDVARRAARAGADVVVDAGGGVRIAVAAGITATLGGLVVDPTGHTAATDVFAVGGDAVGSGLGGTASGLAQALVLGRAAGRAAATT